MSQQLFLKKRFNSFKQISNQSSLDIDEAALQKRFWNYIIAENFKFKRGLDLFGGVGFSAHEMSRCCEQVDVIEKEKKTFVILKENLKERKNINYFNQDNLSFLENTNQKYDYIDFDPFGNANMQLEYLPKIFSKGIVCITSGEISMICRNLPNVPEFMEPTRKEYSGKKAWLWAERIYLPYIRKKFNLIEICYYSFPTSVRSIFYKGIKVSNRQIQSIKEACPYQYIGWFKKYAYSKKQRGFMI